MHPGASRAPARMLRDDGLIDLHCHILPGLDDGALDVDDSIAMAREAHDDGIAVVCATPHIRDDHDVRIEQLTARVAALQRELDARGVAVRIAQGGELAQPLAERMSEAQLREVSLGGGGWVLLEPAPGPIADELDALVGRLTARGVRVVLAHPERHAGADLEQRLRALVDRGCLVQWTAQFVLSAERVRPEPLVLRLARDGLVHLLASDAHSSRAGRPLRLRAALSRLGEVCSPEQLTWIAQTAPEAILRGEPITAPF